VHRQFIVSIIYIIVSAQALSDFFAVAEPEMILSREVAAVYLRPARFYGGGTPNGQTRPKEPMIRQIIGSIY